jgi:hypothetical protein
MTVIHMIGTVSEAKATPERKNFSVECLKTVKSNYCILIFLMEAAMQGWC